MLNRVVCRWRLIFAVRYVFCMPFVPLYCFCFCLPFICRPGIFSAFYSSSFVLSQSVFMYSYSLSATSHRYSGVPSNEPVSE